MLLDIKILKQCEKELLDLPLEVKNDLYDSLAMLQNGMLLTMPLSRPLSNVHISLHELRLKDRTGIYRIIYFIKKSDAIYLLHAFKKKTQKLPFKNIEIVKNRLRQIK